MPHRLGYAAFDRGGAAWRDAVFAPQRQLAGRTAGLVGMGYVGRRVARLLRAFGPRLLDLLRDGAIFVNCARSWVVDEDALLRTLGTGRVWAALDVFDQEPLPADSPFRTLSNVLLTPHQAGYTIDTYHQQGVAIVDEIARFFAGGELRFRIPPESFALMA